MSRTELRHVTPLRYPGGKQKVCRLVADVLLANNLIGGTYVEPYAGGAGVAVELLVKGIVRQIHLNDIDQAVHAFWWTVLNEPETLCRAIRNKPLTIDEWQRQRKIYKNPEKHPLRKLGFAMFYLNRCNRSGIMTGGVIGGLDQTGNYKMDARYNKQELIRRIEAIAEVSERIQLHSLDAEKFIEDIVPTLPQKTLIYLDPPYFNKGAQLYKNHYKPADHEAIAQTVQSKIQHPWIVSYDATPEISTLYQLRRQYRLVLQYSAANTGKGTEILIAKDGLKMPGYLEAYGDTISAAV